MRTMNARYDIAPITRSLTEKAVPPLLLALLGEFDREKISYCYWKSSRRVPAVLNGESDVDLLVAREDQHGAQAILLARGFKHFPPVTGQDHPAISSFLGYDERSGRLIHVHFHVHLIVGERLLKNYRVPWEHIVLARAVLHPTLPIRILDPASEAILLVVRACLELRRLDPMTLRGWQATTRKFELDRRDLVARVDRTTLRNAAAELLSEELAEPVADAFYSGQALERQTGLSRRIRRHFAADRTYNAFEARMRSAGRAVLWVAGHFNKSLLHAPRPWNRRAPGGGRVIAIMGIDGSGKSSSVAAMRAWLGSEIDVVPIYFGTGDGRPSLALRPFKLMVPLITRMLRSKPKPKGASHGKVSGRAPGLLYSVLLMVWAAAVALDKRKKLIAARRGASRGLIVLADRFPQDQILGFNDGPLMARLTAAPHWLRRFEAAVYALAHRLPPDLVIKLVVTPETVAKREPDMNPAIIRERIAALPRLEFAGARVVSIDAERPQADVIRAIKHEIWSVL
jgi:hypothetical protein